MSDNDFEFTLIGQGGGMTASYHAGVISGIKEKFGFSGLRRVVGSSGSAANYSYLLSGQQDLIVPIWRHLLDSGKFVSFTGFPLGKDVMDIDYLIDEVIKKKFPLDLESLRTSPVDLEVGVTNAETGIPRYYSKNDSVDFFELLRASCAVPYFSREKVYFDGDHYYDGTIGSVSGLERVFDDQNLLIVLTRPQKLLPKMVLGRRILKWLLIRKETMGLQETIWSMVSRYDAVHKEIDELAKKRNVCVIQPAENLPMFRIDSRLSRLERTIQQGYLDTINKKELEKFFDKF